MSDPGEIFDVKLSLTDIVVLRRIILRTSAKEMRNKRIDADDIARILAELEQIRANLEAIQGRDV